MPNQIEIAFGDGDYIFALLLPQKLELQEKCGAGFFEIYGRIMSGRYMTADGAAIYNIGELRARIEDCYEVVRLGLIGGGKGLVNGAEVEVGANRARQLVVAYLHTAPDKEAWDLAAAIIGVSVEGAPKSEKKSPDEPAKGSTKRKSSRTAPPSA